MITANLRSVIPEFVNTSSQLGVNSNQTALKKATTPSYI